MGFITYTRRINVACSFSRLVLRIWVRPSLLKQDSSWNKILNHLESQHERGKETMGIVELNIQSYSDGYDSRDERLSFHSDRYDFRDDRLSYDNERYDSRDEKRSRRVVRRSYR
jgi:hypothetical protein